MPHDTSPIATIVVGLALAFCGGFLARKLRLPPLVGYLLAGVAVGPFDGEPRGLAAQVSGDSLALTLALTLGKVALFIALVYLVGTRVVPWLLQQVARTGSRELFTLSVLATALGIAYGSAELFGVSFALGLASIVVVALMLTRAF